MGNYLDRFKHGAKKVDKRLEKWSNSEPNQQKERKPTEFDDMKDFDDFPLDNFSNQSNRGGYDPYFDEVGVQASQKSESFHHYILDNKFKDLERSIRGWKDIWDKDNKEWITIRKSEHCFTDEEAEDVLRMAQSHLSADVKLANMSLEAFGKMMDLLFDELEDYFYRIAEYKYGRYNTFNKNGVLIKVNYDKQGKMKSDNKKILVELYNRIWVNYSRAIGGKENKYTHESVKGQESLQNSDRDLNNNGKRFDEQRRW